jgi:hypothetical protein
MNAKIKDVIGKSKILFLPIAIGMRNSYCVIGTALFELRCEIIVADICEAFALRA